jgi:hypothetical protein
MPISLSNRGEANLNTQPHQIKCLNQAISQVPCGATDQSCICTAQGNNLPDLISSCGIAAGCAVDAANAGANIGNYCFSALFRPLQKSGRRRVLDLGLLTLRC